MEFDLELALTILYTTSEGNDFPVDFDNAWQWCDYSIKGKALQALKTDYNVEGEDFITETVEQLLPGAFGSSRKVATTKYYLSVDCFKDFALKARTKKGREVRKYFIQAEKRMKVLEKQMKEMFDTCMALSGMTSHLSRVELLECYAITMGIKPQSVKPALLKMGWNGEMAMYQCLLFKGYGDKLVQVMKAAIRKKV